ncbi:hypothetical protein BKI52_01700 [marine bacterium AO1-C]|nr:hypothetical protein BKI52_01700 [marine bacterium AO1-C]
MDKKIVTKKGMIYYDEALNSIVALWNDRFMLQGEYRDTISKALDMLDETNATSFITDTRNTKVLSQEQQKFQIEELFPRFMKSSLKRAAYIMPKDIFVQSAVNRSLNELTKYIEVKQFDDLESAKTWIREENIKTHQAENKNTDE